MWFIHVHSVVHFRSRLEVQLGVPFRELPGAVLSVLVASISTLVFGMALGFTSPAIDVMQNTLTVNGKPATVPSDLVTQSKLLFSQRIDGDSLQLMIPLVSHQRCLVQHRPLLTTASTPLRSSSRARARVLFLAPCFNLSPGVLNVYDRLYM